MWNAFRTDTLGGIVAGVSMMTGGNGNQIHTYIARPDGAGPYPGVVMTHHAPGWDEYFREFARRFAEHGFIAIVPNLFEQFGQGTPDDVAAAARGAGGVSDASVIGDSQAALDLVKNMPWSNGKVGVIGTCSGGRHSLLVATKVPGFSAAADLWGAQRRGATRQAHAAAARSRHRHDARIEHAAHRPVRQRRHESRVRTRSTSSSKRSKTTASSTSFTATTAPGTGSSTTTCRRTGSSRPWTAGTKSKTSSIRTCGREELENDVHPDYAADPGQQRRRQRSKRLVSGHPDQIGYDHTAYLRQEHALLLDFVNPGLNPGARVAVELDIPSGKALLAQLQAAIQAAEESGL